MSCTGSDDDETLNGCDSFGANTNCPSLTHMKPVQAQRGRISLKLTPAVRKKGCRESQVLSTFWEAPETFKDICMNL